MELDHMKPQKTFDSYQRFQTWVVDQLHISKEWDAAMAEIASATTDEERVSLLAHRLPSEPNVHARFSHKSGLATMQSLEEDPSLRSLNRAVAMAPHPEKDEEYEEDDFLDLCSALLQRAKLLLHSHPSFGLQDAQIALKLKPSAPQKWRLLEIGGCCAAKCGNVEEAEKLLRASIIEIKNDQNSGSELSRLTGTVVRELKSLKPIATDDSNLKDVSVSYNPHPTITSASSGVRLNYSDASGRHLVAAKPLRAGDVLIIEEPFAWTLLPESYATHCLNCCGRTIAQVPCYTCAKVGFCSPECRDSAWEKFHRYECRVMELLDAENFGKMALLSFRVVVSVGAEGLVAFQRRAEAWDEPDMLPFGVGPGDVFDSQDYASVYHQVTHSNKRSKADLIKRTIGAVFLMACLDQSGFTEETDRLGISRDWVGGLLLRHLQSCACNAYEICETRVEDGDLRTSEGYPIGGAAYPTVSLTNHSCCANTARHSAGRKCIMRAIKPIAVGEVITDNYGFHFQSTPMEERCVKMHQLYMFHCDCPACVENWEPLMPTKNPFTRYSCPKCHMPCEMDKKKCLMCGGDLKKFMHRVEALRKRFKDAKSQVLSTSQSPPMDVLNDVLLLIEFLFKVVSEPNLEIMQVQQFVKLCWSLQCGIFFT